MHIFCYHICQEITDIRRHSQFTDNPISFHGCRGIAHSQFIGYTFDLFPDHRQLIIPFTEVRVLIIPSSQIIKNPIHGGQKYPQPPINIPAHLARSDCNLFGPKPQKLTEWHYRNRLTLLEVIIDCQCSLKAMTCQRN